MAVGNLVGFADSYIVSQFVKEEGISKEAEEIGTQQSKGQAFVTLPILVLGLTCFFSRSMKIWARVISRFPCSRITYLLVYQGFKFIWYLSYSAVLFLPLQAAEGQSSQATVAFRSN